MEKHDPAWLETTLRQRWQQLAAVDESRAAFQAPTDNDSSTQQLSLGPHDITGLDIESDRLSEHLIRFRTHDWASTDLGPMSSWSLELRRMVNLCMADPRPVALWWGPNRLLLHNDAYRSFLQERYAWALGKSVSQVWHDVPSFPKNFDTIDASGRPAFGEDTLFFVKQDDGRYQELWASWAIMPLPGATRNIGYYNACSLNTRQIIYERRMSTLLALERYTSSASTVSSFWAKVIQGLDANHADVPFAALYAMEAGVEGQSNETIRAVAEQDSSGSSDVSSSTSWDTLSSHWVLQGVLEAAPDHLQLPQSMTFAAANETFGTLFKAAIETREPQLLRAVDGTFPPSLQSRATSRAYGDLCREALLVPIARGHQKTTAACLLLGLNSRCIYDEDYERFISLLNRQLATSMNGAIMAEEEARQLKLRAKLAARDRMHLTERLNVSEQDAKDKEMRFRSMADQAPVAMFEFGPLGELNYVNDSWYTLTGHSRDEFTPLSWVDTFHPDDRALFDSQWSRLISGESVNFEIRLSKPFVSASRITMPCTHVAATTIFYTSDFPIRFLMKSSAVSDCKGRPGSRLLPTLRKVPMGVCGMSWAAGWISVITNGFRNSRNDALQRLWN